MKDPDQEKTLAKSILSDKNCLITGATGGLGREIAKLFVEKNCNNVVPQYNNFEKEQIIQNFLRLAMS